MSSPNHAQPQSQNIPNQYRVISRNNSNTSTASSSNKGDISSTISTANSVASDARSQLSKLPFDHRQLFATCGSSTPIKSFQRATISSAVKTRAFDNNPVLQGLLQAASPSGKNSASNSQTPSPLSTPIFSRSRSLRMSGGPNRYQNSPLHYRTSSRTPELYSFNSGDLINESQAKLVELTNEKLELKESLEFSECERQVLIDTVKELKDHLQLERSNWKRDQEELKKQATEFIAARLKAESQLTRNQIELDDSRQKLKKLEESVAISKAELARVSKVLEKERREKQELAAINDQLNCMLSEKLRYNGSINSHRNEANEGPAQDKSECISIVTEMARLRIELNDKDRLLEKLRGSHEESFTKQSTSSTGSDIDALNKFLDQTVECIKGWPDELASSSHVKNLMKTLLSAYRVDHQDELILKVENIHL